MSHTLGPNGEAIMYPKDIIARALPVEQQTCFVLMPFAETFQAVYATIGQAIEGPDVGFASCRRADELFGGGHIMQDVIQGIVRAEIVIADVTGRNPNVFYELGIAHSVKDVQSVVLLTQSIDDVPFDLRHLRHIVYDATPSGLPALRGRLIDAVRSVTPADLRCTVADGAHHIFATRLPGPDRYLYEVEVASVITGRAFAKFQVIVRRHGVGRPVEIIADDFFGIDVEQSITIPALGWQLKLDEVSNGKAHFCLCEPAT